MPVEEVHILLESLLPYSHAIVYPKCMGGGIQAVHEANELLLVMTLCRHNGAMEYMLQIRESTIYRIMLAWEVFMKAIF